MLTWFKDLPLPSLLAHETHVDHDVLLPALLLDALREGGCVHVRSARGECNRTAALVEALRGRGYWPFWSSDSEKHRRYFMVLAGEQGVISLDLQEDHGEACAYARGAREAEELEKLFEEFLRPDSAEDSGSVYLLVRSRHGYGFRRTRRVGTPLLRTNYMPEVITAYERVASELPTDAPSGRLVILRGVAGGGKSYLVRGLVHDLRESCSFLLVPTHLLAGLSDPTFLPALYEHAEDEERPLVMILEDADHCLLRRGSDNIDALSTLLNFSDGIFGSTLDLRVVATTNSKNLDREDALDPAVLRPGRLLAHIDVSPLTIGRAREALHGIVGHGDAALAGSGPLALAQVYEQARKSGWQPPKSQRRRRRDKSMQPWDEA